MNQSPPDDQGASAVEYALLIAGIAAIIVIAVFALGPVTKEMFTDTCDNVQGAGSGMSATCSS